MVPFLLGNTSRSPLPQPERTPGSIDRYLDSNYEARLDKKYNLHHTLHHTPLVDSETQCRSQTERIRRIFVSDWDTYRACI